MVQRAVARGAVHECEAATVKELGDEVGDHHVARVAAGSGRQPLHLLDETRRHVPPLDGNDLSDDHLRRDVETEQLDLGLFGFDIEEEALALAHVVAQQRAVLIAHLVRGPLEVQHAVTVDFFEEALATARNRPGFGVGHNEEHAESGEAGGWQPSRDGHGSSPGGRCTRQHSDDFRPRCNLDYARAFSCSRLPRCPEYGPHSRSWIRGRRKGEGPGQFHVDAHARQGDAPAERSSRGAAAHASP